MKYSQCSPPRPSLQEVAFIAYVINMSCVIKGLFPFEGENKKEERKKRLDNFNRSVRKILANKKALINKEEIVSLDEREKSLEHFCDEIINILFNRRKDLRETKMKDESDCLLFLNEVFNFFLSDKNLPSFINLIFKLVSGGSIFSKEGDDEKDREWLDGFEFKA